MSRDIPLLWKLIHMGSLVALKTSLLQTSQLPVLQCLSHRDPYVLYDTPVL